MKDIPLSRKCPAFDDSANPCPGVLWLDRGEAETRQSPGYAPLVYCPECGYSEPAGEAEYELMYGKGD